jgi:hypothetical protein
MPAYICYVDLEESCNLYMAGPWSTKMPSMPLFYRMLLAIEPQRDYALVDALIRILSSSVEQIHDRLATPAGEEFVPFEDFLSTMFVSSRGDRDATKVCRRIISFVLKQQDLDLSGYFALISAEVKWLMAATMSPLTYTSSDWSGVRNWDDAYVIASTCNAAYDDGNHDLAIWLSAFLEKQIVMEEQDSNAETQGNDDEHFPGFISALASTVGDPQTASWLMQHYVRLGQNAVDTFRACFDGSNVDRTRFELAYFEVEVITRMHLKNPHAGYCGALTSMKTKRIISETNLAGDFEYLVHYIVPMLKERGCPNTELGFKMYQWLTEIAASYMRNKDTISMERMQDLIPDPADMTENARFSPFELGELFNENEESEFEPVGEYEDVKLEPYGSYIFFDTYAGPAEKLEDASNCVICVESVASGDEEICKLNCCTHVYHTDCISSYVNGAFPGKEAVRCPLCAAKICDPRPLRPVEEDSVMNGAT